MKHSLLLLITLFIMYAAPAQVVTSGSGMPSTGGSTTSPAGKSGTAPAAANKGRAAAGRGSASRSKMHRVKHSATMHKKIHRAAAMSTPVPVKVDNGTQRP